jgi:hypothetical protein
MATIIIKVQPHNLKPSNYSILARNFVHALQMRLAALGAIADGAECCTETTTNALNTYIAAHVNARVNTDPDFHNEVVMNIKKSIYNPRQPREMPEFNNDGKKHGS